jgi:NADH dehydrogenase
MKKVFVTGGTGFVGSYVIHELLKRGLHVTALTHGRKAQEGAETVRGDILRPETFAGALKGMDAVIHLVGIIREFPSKGVTFENMHYNATVNVVEAAEKAEVKRFVHMSANGTRENAVSMYHITKFRAEQHLKNSGLDWTIFRPSLVYGPGDSFISMLAGFMKNTPVFTYFGDGSYPMQPISAYETAEAFADSLFKPESIGKTYTLCGNKTFTYKELLRSVSEALGSGKTLIPVPETLVSLGIRLFGGFSFFPITKDQFIMLKEGNTCENRDAFEELSIKERDFEEEIRKYII